MARVSLGLGIALLACSAANADELALPIEFARSGISGDLAAVVDVYFGDADTKRLSEFVSNRDGAPIYVYVDDKLFAATQVNALMHVGVLELSGWKTLREAGQKSDQLDRAGKLTLTDQPR